ncbi:MAG: hypothetical protein N4A76_02815 [Firmicutes bacterium]|jgi:hypothetical protein|nr:hypothetical protein [Bacillota bacterium]
MEVKNIIYEMKIASPGDHMVMLYDDYNTDIVAAYIVSRFV